MFFRMYVGLYVYVLLTDINEECNSVEQQVHQIQRINSRNGIKNTVDGRMQKRKVYVNQVGLVMLLS